MEVKDVLILVMLTISLSIAIVAWIFQGKQDLLKAKSYSAGDAVYFKANSRIETGRVINVDGSELTINSYGKIVKVQIKDVIH